MPHGVLLKMLWFVHETSNPYYRAVRQRGEGPDRCHAPRSLPLAFMCVVRVDHPAKHWSSQIFNNVQQATPPNNYHGLRGSIKCQLDEDLASSRVYHKNNNSDQAIIQRECRYYSLVSLAAFLEFGHIEASILVLIHHSEYLPDSLLGRIFVFWQLDH